ncbi:MAG: hypothetical protein Sapg2KO_49290 [Saprospiraceae bacterium]
MTKLNLTLIILLLSILSTLLYLKMQTLQTELATSEQQVKQLVDDNIAELHFVTDYTYGYQGYETAFFDSLMQAYEVLRIALQEDQFKPEAKAYLSRFVEYNLVKTTQIELSSFLKREDLAVLDDIFDLKVAEAANQLLGIINPYGFTNDIYYNRYDIWKVKETEEEIIYHLRLLKNHELRVVSLKILPSPGIEIIGPNLVEIRQPKERKDSMVHFQLYDWAKNDTTEVSFSPSFANNL